MALPYNTWTEDEIQNKNIVADGNYPFEIDNCICKPTKGGIDKDGNPKPIHQMLEIEFLFWDTNGVVKKQRDWIVFMENMDWKLRHLANTTGLLDLYEQNKLDCEHLHKKKGVFTLGTKDFVGNDGIKKKMNFVKDYVKKPSDKEEGEPFVDDDIKF